MEALKKMLNNFLLLEQSDIFFRTMNNNPQLQKLAVKLNQEQLRQGTTANDRKLPNYSETSVKVFGKEPGPIQLYDTGDFYKSFEVILKDDGFIIDGDGLKTDDSQGISITTDLFVVYGEDITGLNDENLSKFVERLLPKVQETILKLILQNVF